MNVFGKILCSSAFVLLLPVVLNVALWCAHLASYHGTCGPHPTDIPEHPCSYAMYSAEFWGGFNGIGLFIFDVAVAFGAGLLVCTFWSVFAVVKLLQSRAPAQST